MSIVQTPGSIWQYIEPTSGATALTTLHAGDLMMCVVITKPSTVWCTAITGGGCAWTPVGNVVQGVTNNWAGAIFMGTVETPGTAATTLSYNGTYTTEHSRFQEFTVTSGAWALDVMGSIDSTGTADWAALTASGSGELYYGYASDSGSATAGSQPGWSYYIDGDGNGIGYNPDTGPGTVQAVWGDSGQTFGMMALVKETAAGNSYRFWPSTNGGPLASYGGTFQCGVRFAVSQPGMWFEGYWLWVPTGGDTVARKFCLWSVTSQGSPAGIAIVPGSTVTSGTLTAGQWNYVPLATPVALSIGLAGAGAGGCFVATTAWTAVNGFADTSGQFGSGGIYDSGLSNGPLVTTGQANSGGGWGSGQLFGTTNNDPTAGPPTDGNGDNFWFDVQVSTTAPAGYSGSYRLYPNRGDANAQTFQDSSFNYVVATEFRLSESCALNKIWYYSPSGTVQLATRASIYSITGADSGSEVVAVTSPTWLTPSGGSFTAGNGWCYCTAPTALTLATGSYKAAVYNSAASPDGWSAKDASTNYWATAEGANGITWGPIYAPQLSSASTCYIYNGSNPGSSPPYDGAGTEAGQCSFAMSGPMYPYLYVDGLAQNYWVDAEVTPSSGTGTTYAVNLTTGSYVYTPLWQG